MKVYCIVNSNCEGYNIIGIYDSKDQADSECEAINQQTRIEKEVLNEYERKRGGTFDFTENDWDYCNVIEWELNTRKPHTDKDYETLQGALDD